MRQRAGGDAGGSSASHCRCGASRAASAPGGDPGLHRDGEIGGVVLDHLVETAKVDD